MPLSKSLDQPEPTFQAPKVAPTHPPPVGAVEASAPFIRPSTNQPVSSDLPGTDQPIPQGQSTSKLTSVVKQKRSSTADLTSTNHYSSKKQSTSKSFHVQPNTNRPSDLSGTGSPALHQVTSKSTSGKDQSLSSMDTGSDSDFSDRPPVDIFVEEGELSDQDPDAIPTLTRHYLKIRHTEKPYGVLGPTWVGHTSQILESTAATGDDNPFAGPKSQPSGKVSVCLPTDDWLCSKIRPEGWFYHQRLSNLMEYGRLKA